MDIGFIKKMALINYGKRTFSMIFVIQLDIHIKNIKLDPISHLI